MKKLLSMVVLCGLLTGCVVTPDYIVSTPAVTVSFEPDVYVGGYYIGYFRPGFGYWTGYGWDINFYAYGHPGWGHYYRGAPHSAWNAYHNGGRYHAPAHAGRWHR